MSTELTSAETLATAGVVELSGVHFSYGSREVLTGVTMTLRAGEIVGLVGPSGSGKTTLLQLAGGLLQPTRGAVRREGATGASSIRWVFQVPTALWRRPVAENVAIGLRSNPMPTRQLAERVSWALDAVGLLEARDRLANTLSGGELQRLQIARALAGQPRLVVADEPTGQLDRAATESVVAALRALRQRHSTVVLATHDPVLAQVCDRRFVIRDGLATAQPN